MGPSLTGRTVVIKDETGEIPWGHMSSVQKWVRAPGLPPLSSMVVFKFLHSWLFHGRTLVDLIGFLSFGGSHWISLIWWISLEFSHWIYMVASFGQFSGFTVLMEFTKVRLENKFCYVILL